MKEATDLFEQECRRVEHACAALTETMKGAMNTERALAKAAHDGDMTKMRKLSEQLQQYAGALEQAANHAATALTWSEDDEVRYLAEGYEKELVDAGGQAGINFEKLDDRLSAFPALLQIQPSQRSVRLENRKVTTLRPRVIIGRVQAMQKARAKLPPDRFIELLFEAYIRLVGKDNIGSGTRLVEIYDLLTLHPEMRKQYDRNEFTRDIHLLDCSKRTTTRAGYEVTFPAATGTKQASATLHIVGPDRRTHVYYGIRFREAQ